MKRHGSILAVAVLLALMVALMAGPIREESATEDEGLVLASGFSYCHGLGFTFDPEAPPLAKMISAAPSLFVDVKLSRDVQQLLTRKIAFDSTRPWSGDMQPLSELFPAGCNDWYFWPYREVQVLGNELLYGGLNDGEKLLAAGRWMQVALTALTGVVIFLWLRRLAGPTAGVFGVGLWVLNPVALAYGHLVLTDMGVTLMVLLAVWMFSRFLNHPTAVSAAVCGLACGGALVMKFTAVVLAPIFLAIGIVHGLTQPGSRKSWKWTPVIAAAAALVILLIYAPYWRPAPSISAEQAARIGVPRWFQVLRPVLIPPDFFKGLALQMAHADVGHPAYLHGEWRQTGWWCYFPVALAVKTPLPWLVLTVTGLVLWVGRLRRFSFEQSMPWMAAIAYFALAMTGSINIGIRYLLPIFPLLAVGTASQFALRPRWMQRGAWLCGAWLLLVTCRAYPHYLEYFNEAAGGPANGYRWLVDSNLDWGQDVIRLKQFLDEHQTEKIYLRYFGQPKAIEYYGIRARRVTAAQAREIESGSLIVSATYLMQPEWEWLRVAQQPAARVGYTMFVFQMDGDSLAKTGPR